MEKFIFCAVELLPMGGEWNDLIWEKYTNVVLDIQKTFKGKSQKLNFGGVFIKMLLLVPS